MYNLKTAPTSEPISTVEAKLFLKVTHSSEDALIDNMVTAARQFLEAFTKRSFVTQTWQRFLDFFPYEIELYHGTVASVTHIKYIDEDGAQQTLNSSLYQTDLISNPARIQRAVDQDWPDIKVGTLNAVEIEFITGVADDKVDQKVIEPILLLIGHIYANRQDVVVGSQVNKMPKGSEYLISSLRLF